MNDVGCDIHAYLEIRKHRDEQRTDGVWINADKWTRESYHAMYPEEGGKKFEIQDDDSIYSDRHYYLFAILAGVRNAWGIQPISKPKGMADDASEEVKAEYDFWGSDGHSHSWVTLGELLAYDWDKKEEGSDFILGEKQLEAAKQKYGSRLHTIIPKQLGFAIEYNSTVRELCSGFLSGTIERMKTHLMDRPDHPQFSITPEDIRMVFWFDN